MTTYGTMQTRIANECVATGLTSEIQDAIQTAIKFYEAHRFTFNQGYMSFTTTGGATAYGASTDANIPYIKRIHTATVGGTNWASDLEPCTYEEIFEMIAENGNTLPTKISYYDSELVLAPPNEAGYTVRVAYVKKLDALSADTDTNAWMTDGELLIRTAAKRIMFDDVLQQYEDADRLHPIEGRAFMNLQAQMQQLSYNAPAKLGEVACMANGGGAFNIRNGL